MGCGKHCRNPRLNGVSEHSGGEKSTLFKIHNDTLHEIGPNLRLYLAVKPLAEAGIPVA